MKDIAKKREQGFSLVELVIVLIISGLFMLALAQFFHLQTKTQQHQETRDDLKIADQMVSEYFAFYGTYPCPADPTLDPTDPDYGMPKCRSDAEITTHPNDCTDNNDSDNLDGVECVTTGLARDGNGDGDLDTILIGALPFRLLADKAESVEFREKHGVDGYGNLLTYAVTEHMTHSTNHNFLNPAHPRSGGINVEDENGISMLDPDYSAHYVIYSHGENGRGGYSKYGEKIGNCFDSSGTFPAPNDPSDPVIATENLELENCDFNDATFVQGLISHAEGSYNDDLMVVGRQGIVDLWKVSMDSSGGDTKIYNTNLGNVGIGTNNPTEALHVVGDLSAEGSASGEGFCVKDPTDLGGEGEDCLNPAALGGDILDMQCANSSEVAYGIEKNSVLCKPVDWVLPTSTCPIIDSEQTFLRGISNKGKSICCKEGDPGSCFQHP